MCTGVWRGMRRVVIVVRMLTIGTPLATSGGSFLLHPRCPGAPSTEEKIHDMQSAHDVDRLIPVFRSGKVGLVDPL
jgi:hypothetical protein